MPTPENNDPRLVDVEKRGGWEKPTQQPSAHLRPAGLPPRPSGGGGAGAAGTGQPSQSSGQGGSNQSA